MKTVRDILTGAILGEIRETGTENGYFIGQKLNDFYRLVFLNNGNFVKVPNVIYPHVYNDDIYGEMIMHNKDVRKQYASTKNTFGFLNNLFYFVNDSKYVYCYFLRRSELKAKLEHCTTFNNDKKELMFKVKKTMTFDYLFKVWNINDFKELWDNAIYQTMTFDEQNKLYNLIYSKKINSGHVLEYVVGGNKDDVFNVGSDENKTKSFDVIPNHEYINMVGYKDIINKRVNGIELKCSFTKDFNPFFRNMKCNGQSTAHGYKVEFITNYIKDNKD